MDDGNSPISRTGTPTMYGAHMAPMYGSLDDQFQAQQLSAFQVGTGPDGRAASPMNGERLDLAQTPEQLLAINATLKTRVSELEVIQELYRGRIQQLEQQEQANQQMRQQENGGIGGPEDAVQLRAQLDVTSEAHKHVLSQLEAVNEMHNQLQKELEDSHLRENMLKRRLDELEIELKEARESLDGGRAAKKPRLEAPAAAPAPPPAPMVEDETVSLAREGIAETPVSVEHQPQQQEPELQQEQNQQLTVEEPQSQIQTQSESNDGAEQQQPAQITAEHTAAAA